MTKTSLVFFENIPSSDNFDTSWWLCNANVFLVLQNRSPRVQFTSSDTNSPIFGSNHPCCCLGTNTDLNLIHHIFLFRGKSTYFFTFFPLPAWSSCATPPAPCSNRRAWPPAEGTPRPSPGSSGSPGKRRKKTLSTFSNIFSQVCNADSI